MRKNVEHYKNRGKAQGHGYGYVGMLEKYERPFTEVNIACTKWLKARGLYLDMKAILYGKKGRESTVADCIGRSGPYMNEID